MDVFTGSDISTQLNPGSMAETKRKVEAVNVDVAGQREVTGDLGKDDFLQLLITQLSNQDPTNPMEDREFIAQMAQFSSLEQMTNLNSEFESMSSMINSSQAMNLLGKSVAVQDGESLVEGNVTEVSTGSTPMVMVQNRFFPVEEVQAVRDNGAGSESVN